MSNNQLTLSAGKIFASDTKHQFQETSGATTDDRRAMFLNVINMIKLSLQISLGI